MLLSHRKFLFGVLILASILYIPELLYAASQIGIGSSDIEVTTIPNNPQPYQDVTINLTSYATDLNMANIVWQNGSTTVLSGIGKTSYSFKTLGPNTNTTLTIGITPPNSLDTITKTVIINPSEIDILWEGIDSYTPPFYKGKSFISNEGLIRAIAMPTDTKGGQINATYTWKNNNTTVQDSSGYNKNAYIFVNSDLNKSEDISVTASTASGYNATNEIQIPIVSPQVIFYEKSPTQGILYNNALTDGTFISADEITVVAEPYFLAIKGNENSFNYNWQINGQDIATPPEKKELTVRPASRGGYATIGVIFENLNSFFQKATGQLKINL